VKTIAVQALDQGQTAFTMGNQAWPAGNTIYSLLAHCGDVGPFAELFVTDLESGPLLVYRPRHRPHWRLFLSPAC
jgi:hypothetical protein